MRIKYTFSLELKCSIMSEKPYNHNVSIGLWIKTTHMDVHQGVWNRREIQLTRPARWLYMPCRRYSICIRNIQIRIGYCIRGNCTSDKYFLFKWITVCKACQRAASVVSSLLFHTPWWECIHSNLIVTTLDRIRKYRDLILNLSSQILLLKFVSTNPFLSTLTRYSELSLK